MEVLQGAEKLITTHRPTIICEVGVEAADSISDFLHSHGYLLHDGSEAQLPLVPKATWNTVAIPT